MKKFDFSNRIIEQVIEELDCAEEYIKIAVFQIHNRELFAKLNEKLRDGIRVELFTVSRRRRLLFALPYDSIHDSIRLGYRILAGN